MKELGVDGAWDALIEAVVEEKSGSKVLHHLQGREIKPKTRKKISKALKGKPKPPGFGKKHGQEMRGRWEKGIYDKRHTPVWRAKQSRIKRAQWADPEGPYAHLRQRR